MKKLVLSVLTTGLLLSNVEATQAGWIKDVQGKYEYYEDADNQLYSNKNDKVKPIDFPQYYQADARWASKRYGLSNMKITGCVPTSLSMIISTFVEDTNPVQVADYIYDTTMEMNTTFSGTSSLGVKAALDYWGLKSQVISSKEDLEAALKSGKVVFGAVGHGIFVKGYSTHAIILSGYENGNTKAVDPDNPARTNKWYSVTDIWNQRSLELEDNELGGAFIAVYK